MSARRIVRRVGARIDILEATDRIATGNPQAAVRFVRAVRETEEMILTAPGMGAARDFDNPALVGMRFHLVRGFPKYLIFYMPRSDGIEVVRILHGARNLEALFSS